MKCNGWRPGCVFWYDDSDDRRQVSVDLADHWSRCKLDALGGEHLPSSTAVELPTPAAGQVHQLLAHEQVVVKEVAEWLCNGKARVRRHDCGEDQRLGAADQADRERDPLRGRGVFVDAARAIGLPEISTFIMSDMHKAEHETHRRMFQVESPHNHGITATATINLWTMQVERLDGHIITRSKFAEIGRGEYSTLHRTVPA